MSNSPTDASTSPNSINIERLAAFEVLQSPNWPNGIPDRTTFEIVKQLEPITDSLLDRATAGTFAFGAAECAEVLRSITDALAPTMTSQFHDIDGYDAFLKLGIDAASPDGRFVEDYGDWIIASLYWSHLSHFRLLTAWLIVDALAWQECRKRLVFDDSKAADIVTQLGYAGPPCYDADMLRGTVAAQLRYPL